MKLTLDFHNHFSDQTRSVQFIRHEGQSQSARAAMRLFSIHAQALFNYGMQICGGDQIVKTSITMLFVDVMKDEKSPMTCWTETKLFKQFRAIIKRHAQTPLTAELVCIPSDVTQSQTEATFLKLQCQFSYEEIASIMCIKKESACALVYQAITKASDKMENHP